MLSPSVFAAFGCKSSSSMTSSIVTNPLRVDVGGFPFVERACCTTGCSHSRFLQLELKGLGFNIPSPSQSVLQHITSASSSCGVSVGAGAPCILMTSLSKSKDIFSCLIREQPTTASYKSMFTTSIYGFVETVW